MHVSATMRHSDAWGRAQGPWQARALVWRTPWPPGEGGRAGVRVGGGFRG